MCGVKTVCRGNRDQVTGPGESLVFPVTSSTFLIGAFLQLIERDTDLEERIHYDQHPPTKHYYPTAILLVCSKS